MLIIIEVIGYLGSILIVTSLFMGNIWKLRWFNMSGCIAFVIYGLLISVYPIVLLNSISGLANAYYILRIWRESMSFKLVKVKPGGPIFDVFIEKFAENIEESFAFYDKEAMLQAECYLVTQDLKPIGLVAFQPQGKKAKLLLDYLTPAFNAWRFYHLLYHENLLADWRKRFTHIYIEPNTIKNIKRYQKIGYQKIGEQWVCSLNKMSDN